MLILLVLLVIAMFPAWAVGMLVAWHIARPQRAPADASNRIAKARLVWFALTREDLIAPHVPDLRRDEAENIASNQERQP